MVNKQESAPSNSSSFPIYRLEPAANKGRRRRRGSSEEELDWFRDLTIAIQHGRWNDLRGKLSLAVSHQDTQVVVKNDEEVQKQQKGGFWKRIATSVVGEDNEPSQGISKLQQMKMALLKQEKQSGRTPLHFCLHHGSGAKGSMPNDSAKVGAFMVPTDITLMLIRLEPRAAQIPDTFGNSPLHTAVLNQLHLEIIASLVEAFPGGISATDSQGQSPLYYAVERAKLETDLTKSPKTFWMAQKDMQDHENNNSASQLEKEHVRSVEWQEEQVDRWAVVHWLLLASATHPQTSLSVGGKKPMLVDALVSAAPPAVVSLLIGASVVLLTFEKRATAFAGTTVYTCISRHYPLTILLSLCLQCPRDVRLVQDETGMGLVAAQFVTGFFRKMMSGAEEWQVVAEFMTQADNVLRSGTLPEESEHPGFYDWWKKMEFLVAFGTGKKLQAEKNYPSRYLLHAALANSDVPPLVVRLLLALYPDSIYLQAPSPQNDPSMEGSWPIHLACLTRDYIPRYYESQMMGSSLLPSPDGNNDMSSPGVTNSNHINALAIVVQADSSAVYKRHNRRLPLHIAIDAGKLYNSLQPLLDAGPETLFVRDPETFLYPWLHVASVGADREEVASGVLGPDGKYNSHSHWAFHARNKYTHHVWRGLSDRQRANAVLKQYNTLEVLERQSTIYKLLRRAPSVMNHIHKHHKVDSFASKKKGPIRQARDESGMGTVAQHYMNYLFEKKTDGGSLLQRREPNEEHTRVFQQAVELAPRGDWSSLPPDFERWFNKMRFWIKYCCPNGSHLPSVSSNFLPTNNERFTLHMAVLNPDTPTAVVELILAVSRGSASTPIPDTPILPLHLAAQTSPYVPRAYENQHEASVIALVAQAHSSAVSETADNGKLPLHLAIETGHANWKKDLEPLVSPDPSVLRRRDPSMKLYPFQLLALHRDYTKDDRMRFQYIARNAYDNEEDWNDLSAREQTRAVYTQYCEYQLHRLTSIFELLRADASILETPKAEETPPPSPEETTEVIQRDEEKAPELEVQQTSSVLEEQQSLPVQSHEEDETETSTDFGYLANTPLSLDVVLGEDLDETETSKSLTEADTIYSVPQSPQTSVRESSLSARSRSLNQKTLPVTNGYIPGALQSRPLDDSSRTGPPDLDDSELDDSESSDGDSSSHYNSTTNQNALPDLDPSDEGSDLLELESHTTNRSGRSAGSTSVGTNDRRLMLAKSISVGSVSTETSEGSRVQDGPGKSSLMRLLSQNKANKDKPPEDVFECDASLLSNLDVMSTLSSTIHNSTGHRPSAHGGGFYGSGAPPMLHSSHNDSHEDSFEESMSGSLLTGIETEGYESSGVEFAGESVNGEASFTFAGEDSSVALSLPMPADFLKKIGSDSEDEESEAGLVYFQFRRKPRTVYWEDTDMVNAPVRLASSRRSGGNNKSAMDISTTSNGTSPLLQMVTASTSHSSISSGLRPRRSSKRLSSVSLKSHLSDTTYGDTRHTFKSFATDGSARSGDKSFATSGGKSYGTLEEKSFATSNGSHSYEGDKSYTSLSPGSFKPKPTADMKWVADQFEKKQRRVDTQEGDDDGSHSARSLQVASLGSGKSYSDSASTPSRSGIESLQSLKSPFDLVEAASKSVGMMWLDDESESGSTHQNEQTLSSKVRSLLHSSQTSFDESRDDLLFHEFSDASSFDNAPSSASSSSSKKAQAPSSPLPPSKTYSSALGEESDSESSSSVMQFNSGDQDDSEKPNASGDSSANAEGGGDGTAISPGEKEPEKSAKGEFSGDQVDDVETEPKLVPESSESETDDGSLKEVADGDYPKVGPSASSDRGNDPKQQVLDLPSEATVEADSGRSVGARTPPKSDDGSGGSCADADVKTINDEELCPVDGDSVDKVQSSMPGLDAQSGSASSVLAKTQPTSGLLSDNDQEVLGASNEGSPSNSNTSMGHADHGTRKTSPELESIDTSNPVGIVEAPFSPNKTLSPVPEQGGSPLAAHLSAENGSQDGGANLLSSTIGKYLPESTMIAPQLESIEEEISITSSQVSITSSDDMVAVFDRATMKWVKRRKSLVGVRRMSNDSSCSGTSSTTSQKRRVFDKKTFTWQEVDVDHASTDVRTIPTQSSEPAKKRKKKASITLNLIGKSAILR
eukprot:CAMPEP_0168748244 /NCGR_PEP_ID=MMETSP0724-20121128/16075_1 /TAXON_ID=265536 /ORGANISM="Amphiprora sp., Strain CCMP467" /LENGTH=2129 /DNA_ID=CAMNT_0008796065 /DNA_START=166 /DNA_END=6551 /DNA_ORIENTATION=-